MVEGIKGTGIKFKFTKTDGTVLESEEFIIPNGAQGAQGEQGVGVASMELVYSGTAPSPTKFEIGDLFFSSNSKSPAIRFGGTWTQIKDRFILAAGDTWLAGTEGGSSSGYKEGNWRMKMITTNAWENDYNIDIVGSAPATAHTFTKGIGIQGQTSQSGNMPPFLAVYVWQKISN